MEQLVEKITAKKLLASLNFKYPNAAILPEVSVDDEEEAFLYRTAKAIVNPSIKKIYDSQGLDYGTQLPTDYRYKKGKPPQRRIDALVFDGRRRIAIEIKISHSDFLKDSLSKRAPWMLHTNQFYYLVPRGLVKYAEIPEGCGLMEWEDDKISVARRAPRTVAKDFPSDMVRYFAWRAFVAEKRSLQRL